jgi:vacuolar protein sorting-associated protein 13A/C
MLEGLVANLLNRFLGMYVRNFDPKQLNIDIWSGEFKLKNLELRREAMDQLHLPLNVIEGQIGQLTLSIPWSNLRGKPVRVNIEDVYVLAAPKEDEEYNAEEEENRAHAVKMEKLDSAELLKERNTDGMSAEEQQKNQTFTASLLTAIVDNLQISVKNVHVRYEDSIADPGHPFAAGVTLSELSAFSTDEKWKPTFIQSTSGTTHKLATLGALAIYWDTDTKLIGSGKGSQTAEEQGMKHDDVLEKLKETIVKKDGSSLDGHQYILKPVTGRAGLEMDKTGKTDKPKVKIRLLFNKLGFVIDDDQYRDALMLVDLFHHFLRHQEYKKLQPRKSPKEDPLAWLKFAGKAMLKKIHDRNYRWSWAYFKERRDNRIKYIELFKKKKTEEKLGPDELKEIDALERKLTYEDLRFWRSLARNQLRKENVAVKKAPAKQSWSSWVWGGVSEDKHDGDESQMTEEQRKELYSAIHFDEKKTLTEAVDMPKEAIKLQVDMSLGEGSFTLKRDHRGRANELLRLVFQGFNTKFLQRTDSMLAKVSLKTMKLIDGTTEGNLFTQLLHIKQEPSISDEDRVQQLDDDDMGKKADSSANDIKEGDEHDDDDDEHADPFFALTFEQNPLDNHADTALTMKLEGMEFVYNPKFVSETVKFFKPPARHMESIGALMETAGATVEGLRQQTRAGLEFALQEHKTIDMKLDLQAPLIIVPDSVTSAASICMILDAGHISVRSDLIDKDILNEVQSKQKQQYTEADHERLEQLMYDKFLVKLDSTQVLMGSSIEETRKQLGSKNTSKSLHIIDRINMDFTVETCIMPQSADLTKFRVKGHLPVLHASVSDYKYKSLMKLLDVAILKFDDDDDKAKRPTSSGSETTKTLPRNSLTDKDVTGRPRSKSFQFSAQQHELVMEEDVEHGHQGETEGLKDAQGDDKSQPQVNISQRNFEFRFTVDKLQGSLYKSDAEGKKPDELLVDLIAEHFNLEFYQRKFDMVADVRLRSLTVEDHVEQNSTAEFKNLISSKDASNNQKHDLFSLKFVKVNKQSPEFMTKYEGFATNIDASMSTISLLVTRKTLLTLLDFVMITFTNPDAPQVVEEKQQSDNESLEKTPPQEDDKIRVKAQLKRIAIILNNDGIRLATLSLTSAEVGVFLMGTNMRVGAKLGNLSLIDDINQGISKESSLRQLVTIQGQELADFRYETFDADSDVYPGYDSSAFLRSGSIKINFITEPFRKIMEFAIKFGKMQAIFHAARQAAAQDTENIQQRASKMHFDIKINTLIVAFPRMVFTETPERDVMTVYLVEIYARNEFLPLDDSKNAQTANKLSAGINNVRLMSKFNYAQDNEEELELIDKVDLDFRITTADHESGSKRPDTEIAGSMSNLNLRVTEAQLKFILELTRSIPAAFATEPDGEIEEEVKEEMRDPIVSKAKAFTDGAADDEPDKTQPSAHLGPEIGSSDETWTTLDLVFGVGAISLELISGKPDSPIGDLAPASLSKFSLNETNVKLRKVSDGSMESELLVQSFTITDTRTRDKNKFRKIMSLINTDVKQQFMASVSISGGNERNLIAYLTIDSPRIILSLDYLFAIQGFTNAGLATDEPLDIDDNDEEEPSVAGEDSEVASISTQAADTSGSQKAIGSSGDAQSAMSISYRVNVVDAQFILIANPSLSSSEAIVLGTKQVLVNQHHLMTLQVEKLGIFLCRMDSFDENKLRILDDFSIHTLIDIRTQNQKASSISLNVDIKPLILRLALRDILLVQQTINRASALSNNADDEGMAHEGPSKIDQIKAQSVKAKSAKEASSKAQAKTVATKNSNKPAASSVPEPQGSAVLKREEMTLSMKGIRVVLLGDSHELPMFDWSVKNFAVKVQDWSGAMTADTRIDTFINVFNFSKSAWEPLIEPWAVDFHMAKSLHLERMSVDLYSRKSMELTITSATIALAYKSFSYLDTEEDILSKPRGVDAPYRIRNYTGFDINVWAQTDREKKGAAVKMDEGEEIPWRFEDPTTTRETLSTDGATGVVGVKLEGSGFDSIDRIPVQREGEVLYNLKPRKDKVQHRILVDVKLGADNVKYITFRSPLLVENNTQIPIEVGVYSPDEGHLLKIEKVAPGDARSAPVGAAYMHSLVIRPDQGFGYTWSNERLFWKDLLKRPTRTITCQGEQQDSSPPFYFQMQAVYDKNNPITATYPYMRIRVSAPVEIQNLLPFDFKYRIYDKNAKKDWTNYLRKGGVSPVHVVELSHLLLFSIDMQDTSFKQSDFGIINSSERDGFRREKTLVVRDNTDLNLRLKLHYQWVLGVSHT